MTKSGIAKGLGAAGALAILFGLYQNIRSEVNDLRERTVRLETIIGDTHD